MDNWIPVTERLPEEGTYVFVYLDGFPEIVLFDQCDQWRCSTANLFEKDIDCWHPLPLPPETILTGHTNHAPQCLEYLNEVSGRRFEKSKHLEARLKDFSVDQVKQVIAYQSKEWMGTKWQKFLRPETLFNKTKFEGYLNDAIQGVSDACEESFIEKCQDKSWRKGLL